MAPATASLMTWYVKIQGIRVKQASQLNRPSQGDERELWLER
jgi:hypothetical protein